MRTPVDDVWSLASRTSERPRSGGGAGISGSSTRPPATGDPRADEVAALVATEQWDALGTLLDDGFFAYMLSVPDALAAALDVVPAEWLGRNPRHYMTRSLVGSDGGALGFVGDVDVQRFIDWVEGQGRPATRDVLAVLLIRVRSMVAGGRLAEADSCVDEFVATIRSSSDTAGFRDVVPPVLLRAATVKLAVGKMNAAHGLLAEAATWAHAWGAHPISEHVANHVALVHALQGQYALAERRLAPWAGRRHARPGGYGERYETIALLANGITALGVLDQARAEQVLDTDPGELWYELGWIWPVIRARYALLWGDRHRAIEELRQHDVTYRLLVPTGSLGRRHLDASLVDLLHATDDVRAASAVVAGSGFDGSHPVTIRSAARHELLSGRSSHALARLSRASTDAVSPEEQWRHPDALVLRATAAHLVSGSAGAAALDSAVAAVTHHRAHAALLEAPPPVRAQLAALAQGRAEVLVEAPHAYPSSAPPVLTRREREVLAALRLYPSVREVAAALHVSPNTAKTHIRMLYRKVGVHRRDDVLALTAHLV